MKRDSLSPLDGRYHEKVRDVAQIFCEDAQIRLKTVLELQYFGFLLDELSLDISEETEEDLTQLLNNIDVGRIYEIEKQTKHDIKAIEYYLKENIKAFNAPVQYLHYGLTSQDINSLATSISISSFNTSVYIPLMGKLLDSLERFSVVNDCVFPARTHGQLAVPTTLKKEISVFIYRLNQQYTKLLNYKFHCKFGGAVGNLSAHYSTYPDHDWETFCDEFTEYNGIKRNKLTTQVDNNASLSEYFDTIKIINNILISFTRDVWMYCSYGYFEQRFTANEVGSSTMPQKINPIDFENAEGNLEYSNCLLSFMSDKLQISRMQRDLSDSTVVRNIGTMLAHSVLACKSILSGIEKISVSKDAVENDLRPSMLSEAYQTHLRKMGIEDAYEKVKENSRGVEIRIDRLNVSEEAKEILESVTMKTYASHP